MTQEAYEAFNRLAAKFQGAVGSKGQATEAEASQMVADCLNDLANRISEDDLSKALDEFRTGQDRIKKAFNSVEAWQTSDDGKRKEKEFKRLVAELYTKMNYSTLAS